MDCVQHDFTQYVKDEDGYLTSKCLKCGFVHKEHVDDAK